MAAVNVDAQLLRAQEVANLLGISKRGVFRLASAGYLPGRIKIGRCARWRRDVIEHWIAAGCPRPRARRL